VGTALWLFENTLFSIGRLGVPLFLAITGALLLGRKIKPASFYKRSLLPLLGTTEIWIFLNYLFVCVFQKVEFSLGTLLKEMLFLQEPELSHMWYMPMILGIYLVLPFLSRILSENIEGFSILYLAACIIFLVVPTVNVFLMEALPFEKLSISLGTDFLGGTYGLYLFGGYFIARRKLLATIRNRWLFLTGILAFLMNTAGQYFLYSHGYTVSTGLLWYSSIFIFLMGMVLFELLRRIFLQRHERKIIRTLAGVSFGIYLLHKPIQIVMLRVLSFSTIDEKAAILLLWMGSFAVSMLLLLPFQKRWKKVGKWLFHTS
jgi:surface polysaccharide O-acyltransferase-like enzyme